MHAPRYAGPRPSRARIVTGAALAVAAAVICVQVFGNDSHPAAAAAIKPVTPAVADATTAPTSSAAAAPVFLEQIAIHPSVINTVAAAKAPKKAAPAAGLVGPAGQIGALGIPVMVLHAYHLAADKIAVSEPSCKLPWWLLAGIGHTESGHAEAGRLDADGTTRGLILGPPLNGGIAGDAVISDTDKGKLDGDKVYDRAVGPMQFIPSTWARWGADGNGDGVANPSNIYDATLAAGHYLCADGRDLSTPAGQDAAVLSYNHSAAYLATVLAWGKAYAHGASSVPDSALPTIKDVTKARPKLTDRPKKAAVHKAKPVKKAPTKAKPKPSASESASASPTASATPTKTSCAPTTSASSTSPNPSTSPTVTDQEKTLAPGEKTLAPLEKTLAPLEKTLAPLEKTLAPREKTLAATASATATETAHTGGNSAASSAGSPSSSSTTSATATATATTTPTGCR